jgi:hypothetical protein
VPLDELAPHLPNELTALVERCLAGPDERPADARAVCDELATLRQRFGGRASAVQVERASTERVVVSEERVSPKRADKRAEPACVEHSDPKPKAGLDAIAIERKVVERAATEPIVDPNAVTAFAATAFAVPAPISAAVPVIEFSMADAAAPLVEQPAAASAPEPEPEREPTREATAPADDAAAHAAVGQTRTARAKSKSKKLRVTSGPALAVAGPARLAAAFGPLDGTGEIEQGESAASELSRAFRESLDEPKHKPAKPAAKLANAVPAAPRGSPQATQATQARQAKADAQKALVDTIAFSKLQNDVERRRKQRDEVINGALMLLFALGLARAVPLLSDASGEAARALLGTKLKLSAGVFSTLTVVVLVRTWALQIQANVALLKPVLFAFKVVAACVCVLALGYFLPAGALGPAGRAARIALPFSAAFFFLFLGVYGLMQGLSQLRASALMGATTLVLYSASFVGSFQITQDVIVPSIRKKPQAAMNAEMAAKLGIDPSQLKNNPQLGAGPLDSRALESAGGQVAEDGFKENRMTGGNEEEDLKSIREMGDARKRNSKKLDEMNNKLPSLIE